MSDSGRLRPASALAPRLHAARALCPTANLGFQHSAAFSYLCRASKMSPPPEIKSFAVWAGIEQDRARGARRSLSDAPAMPKRPKPTLVAFAEHFLHHFCCIHSTQQSSRPFESRGPSHRRTLSGVRDYPMHSNQFPFLSLDLCGHAPPPSPSSLVDLRPPLLARISDCSRTLCPGSEVSII